MKPETCAAPLNVLVVDDSAVVREVMSVVLTQEPGIKVTTAADPFIAMDKMRHQRPDVIILDLEMPRMDGLTFLQKIVGYETIPVVICSALTGAGTAIGIQALAEGAVEIVTKPRLGVKDFLHESAVLLIDTVKAAAHSQIARRQPFRRSVVPPTSQSPSAKGGDSPHPSTLADHVVALGASTGGTEAIREVLERMPPDAPGIVVVQHMPEGFTAAFAQRLDRSCRIDVKEAVDGEQILKGCALIAPGNRHMAVHRGGGRYWVEITDGPLVSRHRPSVDFLFRSVAQNVGLNALGVIMTGMGRDGAEGLLAMKQAGALTIGQDEASCVIYGMPKEATELGAVDLVVPLAKIADTILTRVNDKHRALMRLDLNS